VSVESMAIALHHSRASGTAKVVLLGICNHDGDGGSWPSIETLAKYANKSERQVQRAIRELEELGEVHTRQQAGGHLATRSSYRPNAYDVLLQCPPDCDRTSNHRVQSAAHQVIHRIVHRGDVHVTPHGLGGDTGDGGGVTPTSPEPSLEPSLKDSPNPRAARRGVRCSKHPNSQGANCRSCGTNPRALRPSETDRLPQYRPIGEVLAEQERLLRSDQEADRLAPARR
jgi:DNA-binding transcriptional regulator YhcF (GntR family)